MTQLTFNIGSQIQCRDGQCGELTGVVVDPETLYVTDVIIKKGFLLKQNWLIPISLVERAEEDDVYLTILSEVIDQYPKYRVVEREESAVALEAVGSNGTTPNGLYSANEPNVPIVKQKTHKGIGPEQIVIEKEKPVKNIDGVVGNVTYILVDNGTKEIDSLVVRQGVILIDQRVIPNSIIENITEDSIFVSGTKEALKHLPVFTS